MDSRAFGNIFAGTAPRSVTLGTSAMATSIQVQPAATPRNRFEFSELRDSFVQALNQVTSGAAALALIVRYDPQIVDFAKKVYMTTGWQNLDGQLIDRSFERVELSPYKDTELSFDLKAKEVIASTLRVKAMTDKGPREIGIGIGVAVTTGGLIYPKPEPAVEI